MRASCLVASLLLLGRLLLAGPSGAGPLAGSGYWTLLVLDANRSILLLESGSFAFDGADRVVLEETGPVEAQAILAFDPDPLANYEFSIRNTSGDPIEGALSFGITIDAGGGGAPAWTRLECVYTDGGDGVLDERVQHVASLFEDVGPGWYTYLTDLILEEQVTSEEAGILEAGPQPLPAPGKSDRYDEFAVQLSFDLGAGDVAHFRGAASFPESPPVCGDGSVDPRVGEECDPPQAGTCSAECTFVPEPEPTVLGLAAMACLVLLGGGGRREPPASWAGGGSRPASHAGPAHEDPVRGTGVSSWYCRVARVSPMDELVPGACLCGTVRFSVRLPTLYCGHCHCSMCRSAHGAGYVTWFGVAPSQLRFEAGQGNLVRYRSSEHGTRSFCKHCGSSLFFESTRRPEVVEVALGCMQAPIDRAPQLHVHFADRVDWLPVDESLPQLAGDAGTGPPAGAKAARPRTSRPT